MKISVFTVCMPEYAPEEAVAALAGWGFDGVEWRVTTLPAAGEPVVNFWKGNRCTLAPETLPDQADAVASMCKQHKLVMPCLAPYVGWQEIDLMDRVMQGAAKMGVPLVRVKVNSYDGKTNYNRLFADALKGWEQIVALGRRYGVKPVAEIHMNTIIPSASAALRFISHFKSEEAGIIHDAGNMVYEGYEAIKMGIEILGPYLSHVHVKNSAWSIKAGDPDGNLRWSCDAATLRAGQINWADLIKTFHAVGYDGWFSLENFSLIKPTCEKLPDDLAYLKKCAEAQ